MSEFLMQLSTISLRNRNNIDHTEKKTDGLFFNKPITLIVTPPMRIANESTVIQPLHLGVYPLQIDIQKQFSKNVRCMVNIFTIHLICLFSKLNRIHLRD